MTTQFGEVIDGSGSAIEGDLEHLQIGKSAQHHSRYLATDPQPEFGCASHTLRDDGVCTVVEQSQVQLMAVFGSVDLNGRVDRGRPWVRTELRRNTPK